MTFQAFLNIKYKKRSLFFDLLLFDLYFFLGSEPVQIIYYEWGYIWNIKRAREMRGVWKK